MNEKLHKFVSPPSPSLLSLFSASLKAEPERFGEGEKNGFIGYRENVNFPSIRVKRKMAAERTAVKGGEIVD